MVGARSVLVKNNSMLFCIMEYEMDSINEIWGKIFFKREEIVSREIAGETILVPIKGKLADMQRIFSLDGVGEHIWRQLEGNRKLEEIRDGVMHVFDVEKERVNQDILEFIDELIEAGLIEVVE